MEPITDYIRPLPSEWLNGISHMISQFLPCEWPSSPHLNLRWLMLVVSWYYWCFVWQLDVLGNRSIYVFWKNSSLICVWFPPWSSKCFNSPPTHFLPFDRWVTSHQPTICPDLKSQNFQSRITNLWWNFNLFKKFVYSFLLLSQQHSTDIWKYLCNLISLW